MEPRSTSGRRLGFAAGGSVANNFCWNRPRWIRSWSWVASSMINDNSYPAEMLYPCCWVCFHLFWRWNVWSDVIQRSRCVWIFGGSQKWQDVGFKTVNKTAVNYRCLWKNCRSVLMNSRCNGIHMEDMANSHGDDSSDGLPSRKAAQGPRCGQTRIVATHSWRH